MSDIYEQLKYWENEAEKKQRSIFRLRQKNKRLVKEMKELRQKLTRIETPTKV